jgi:hypothetical protein
MRPGIAEFDTGQLDPDRFNHAEHIRIGWLYLVEYGATDGASRFRNALKRFTKSIGAESKYHATITGFFLDEISKRLDGNDWQAFQSANQDLFDGQSLLGRRYSTRVLESPEARTRYVAPDRNDRQKAS